MFGIDSSEFLLIAIVALVVIGPKDLPRVMRLVGGWVGRGRAMTRHLRSGFDTMMREAELEEMQKQWAKQNADIMAATAVTPATYNAAGTHADAVVGAHVYDHPGALPVAELPPADREGPDPVPGVATVDPRRRGDDGMVDGVATPMTGPRPAAHALGVPPPAPATQP